MQPLTIFGGWFPNSTCVFCDHFKLTEAIESVLGKLHGMEVFLKEPASGVGNELQIDKIHLAPNEALRKLG